MRSARWLYLFLAICGVAYAGSKMALDKHISERKSDADIRRLPTPQVASFLAAGFKPALADIFWIEGINYFGEQLPKKKRNYQYLSSYCDLIFSLDPIFTTFYEWAGTVFIYNGLPIDRPTIIKSTEYVNLGIRNLNKIHRFSSQMILKGAFNYVLEAHAYRPALPYFALTARTFPEERKMLLVASTYAQSAGMPKQAAEFKLEFLGYAAFEAQNKEELNYAVHAVSSDNFQARTAHFVKSMRLQLETDKDIKEAVQKRLQENPVFRETTETDNSFIRDSRLSNVLSVDFNRTWMPPEMLVLFSM